MAKKDKIQMAAEQPALSKHEDFVLKNKNALIGAVVALIVIVAGVIIYNNYKADKLKAAQAAMQLPELTLETAMEQLQQSTEAFGEQNFERALQGDSTGAKGFLQIADEFSSTKAGNLANLYAGLCYAHMEKWEDAVKYLEKFDDAGDFIISPAALGALGNAYAHVNQPDKAVKTLVKAAEKADNILQSPLYYIQAGELLESQGKKAEALKLYEKVKAMQNTSQSSPYVEMIDEYIERAK
mgnify:CR=1 FL=1